MKIGGNQYKLEKRKSKNAWVELLGVILAIVASLGVCALLIAASGADVKEALKALYYGAFGSTDALLESLVQATPLMFTGLAVLIAFCAKVWNIGVEGQLWMAMVGATWANLYLTFLPPALLSFAAILLAMAGGALWGLVAAYCKTRFNANIVIITIMLNYVVKYFISFMLGGIWREPGHHYYQTMRFAENTFLPTFWNSRLHLGFFVAILAAILIYILINKTSFGHEMLAIGENPTSSRYKGIRINRTILLIMWRSVAWSQGLLVFLNSTVCTTD